MKEKILMQGLWKQAPDWAEYIGIDRDGEAWAFDSKPELTSGAKVWRNKIPDGKSKFIGTVPATGYFNTTERRLYIKIGDQCARVNSQ